MVYRLTISYCGSAYAGWQRQKNAVAVQEVVERALQGLLGCPAQVVGASRTDTGVHARGQVAHLELPRAFSLTGLIHGTNHRLPEDVRVTGAFRMPTGFHARQCAYAKEYRYCLTRDPVLSPLDAPFMIRVDPRIDLVRLRQAAQALLGRHDFSAFAASGGGWRSPFRRILAASWHEESAKISFSVVGDGFLRGMVRALVGTLVEVGLNRRSLEELTRLLDGGERSQAGPTAPARGLTLERVFYPERWSCSAPIGE